VGVVGGGPASNSRGERGREKQQGSAWVEMAGCTDLPELALCLSHGGESQQGTLCVPQQEGKVPRHAVRAHEEDKCQALAWKARCASSMAHFSSGHSTLLTCIATGRCARAQCDLWMFESSTTLGCHRPGWP